MAAAEKLLISSVLNEEGYKTAVKLGIKKDMFRAFDEEWDWLENYYIKYSRLPSKEAFSRQFPSMVLADVRDTEHYANELKDSHVQFLLTNIVKDAAPLIASRDPKQVTQALTLLHTESMKVAASIGAINDSDIFSAEDELFRDIQSRVNKFNIYGSAGIPTGFPSLDEATGGLGQGDLIIVAARLGQGKSFVLQRMAAAAAMQGHTVQFDALEQTRAQVNIRLMSMLSGRIGESIFSASDLQQGKNIDLDAWRTYLRKVKDTIPGKLCVADSSGGQLTFPMLTGQIERNKPDIVFVDYLTLMAKESNDWQNIVGLSNGLKHVAGKYQIPVVAAAQLNRERGIVTGTDMPGVEALAYSDAIGHDADMVITMRQFSQRVLCMYMAKNRNGYAGYKVWVRFQPDKGRFDEVDYDLAQDLIEEDRTKDGLLGGKYD